MNHTVARLSNAPNIHAGIGARTLTYTKFACTCGQVFEHDLARRAVCPAKDTKLVDAVSQVRQEQHAPTR